MLLYIAQLAKVFSQGKYYVGGSRKVQICRNCLLTNTFIMHFCLFIVVNNCCLSRTINGILHSNLLIHCRGLNERVSRLLLHSPNNTPLSTEIIRFVEIQI
jgi:hypothetical protein